MPQSNDLPASPPRNKKNKPTDNLFFYPIDNTRIFIESGIKMEVLEQSVIYPIPNAPKWYSGVTSLRGDILTIVNMHFLLNPTSNSKTTRLLKLEHPNFPPLAIAIDNLPHQRDINTLIARKKNNDKHYPEWINSFSTDQNHTYLFADHAALFNAIQSNVSITQSAGDN